MEDGVRLAASLYLPESTGSGGKAPVVLEALPYRKDDAAASDRPEYERLCGEHGYAVARVDLRGTGSSEGVAADEYPASEQADLCQVIGWLAAQPWSTGSVGMYGTSYSGCSSLQVAAERPPALKAVIAIYASDDRYTDDVHYTGGTAKLLDLVDYPLYMVALNALPPVPAIAGPDWRERWRERVACPTMLVAGWADGYRNASFRVMERLRAPCRLLFGQPDDQRSDDAWSLTYDWPLEQEMEVLGHPRLTVRVGASAPVAFLSAKLCDVFPDGTSALVARGFLNLTRRRSLTDPEPMRPGVVETVELELDATSWVFPAGHRLRLSLAGADWPNLVPPPGPVTLTVERDGSTLTLPVLDGPGPCPPPALPPPRPHHPAADPASPTVVWRVARDVLGRRTEAEIDHGGRTELPDGAVLVERCRGTVGTALDRPGRSWARGSADYRIEWPEATVATSARLDLRGDAEAFEVQLDLEAREGDQLRWTRTWRRRIPRHLT
jgi:predicted acyl esterase